VPLVAPGVEIYDFLNTDLHADMLAAFHALGIGERQGEFKATLRSGTVVLSRLPER
jgi:hypothetical protein